MGGARGSHRPHMARVCSVTSWYLSTVGRGDGADARVDADRGMVPRSSPSALLRKKVRSIIWMCATTVQHSPSATTSVKPSTHTVLHQHTTQNALQRTATHCNALQQGKRSIPLEMNVLRVYQNAKTLSV